MAGSVEWAGGKNIEEAAQRKRSLFCHSFESSEPEKYDKLPKDTEM